MNQVRGAKPLEFLVHITHDHAIVFTVGPEGEKEYAVRVIATGKSIERLK